MDYFECGFNLPFKRSFELMKVFILTILFLVNISMLAQDNDKKGIELLDKEARHIQPAGTIFYADKPDKHLFDQVMICLEVELHKKQMKGILLSKVEISQIINQLRMQNSLQLPEDLFKDSRRIRSDNLINVVNSRNQILMDSLRKKSSDIEGVKTLSKLYKWAFYFTKPVYIRSSSLAFVYFRYYNHMGGDESVRIYRFRERKWTYIGAVCGGVW